MFSLLTQLNHFIHLDLILLNGEVMSNVVFPRALRNIMSGCQHVTIKAVHRDKLTSLFNMEMTKEQINRCPIKTFNKEIRVISSIHDEHKKEIKLAIKQMQTSKILGFDTETAVVFNTNINLPISLIQLSNEDTVILWRLRSERKFLQPSFPKTLKDILQSRDIIKVYKRLLNPCLCFPVVECNS